MSFAGRVALVTGGTGGIGAATAAALAEAGAEVFVSARHEPREWAGSDRLRFVAADIAHADQVAGLVDRVVESAGRLDCAVNCAGYEGQFHPIDRYPDSDCRRVLDVNLLGTFWAVKHQVRAMLGQGRGAIVNVASIAGLQGVPLASPYTASKHAVIGLTRSVALEVVQEGIRVNAVCPGLVDTVTADRLSKKTGLGKAHLASASPMRRPASIDEVAAAALSYRAWISSRKGWGTISR